VEIASLADPQKQASDIPLDYNFKTKPVPKETINWGYGLK
jgi:hypothetical protein